MRRGPKPELPETKLARGTYQPCRDAEKVEIVLGSAPPSAPTYLSAAAKRVWSEEIARVMQVGASDLDSSLFARYCSLEALVRAEFKKGRAPPAAYIAQLRQHAELLGLAGRKSRLGQKSGPAIDNPFSRNGRQQ